MEVNYSCVFCGHPKMFKIIRYNDNMQFVSSIEDVAPNIYNHIPHYSNDLDPYIELEVWCNYCGLRYHPNSIIIEAL